MKRDSTRLSFTYNPSVHMSAEEVEEEDAYVNYTIPAVAKEPDSSETHYKHDKKIPAVVKRFSAVAVCWVILLIILVLRIHFTSVIAGRLRAEMKSSDTANANLKAEIHNLRHVKDILENNITIQSAKNQRVKAEYEKIEAENEKIKAENQQLKAENEMIQTENEKIKAENEKIKAKNETIQTENEKIKAENEQLKAENEKIKAENEKIKAENRGIYQTSSAGPTTFTIEPMYNTTSTGYWSHYRQKRQTEPCQTGWLHFQSRCYMIGGRHSSDQRTWGGARDDCRKRNADLVLVESPEDQINTAGAGSYWIGLRFEGGGWKWLNGSDLTQNYWTQPPAHNHHCVVSVSETRGWKAVSCDDKNEWICEKNELSG